MGSTKRKAGALPEEIEQVPAGASGAAPLAVYFPSGFDPNKHSYECAWTTYAHMDKKSQFTVVAATVRRAASGAGSSRCGSLAVGVGGARACTRRPPAARTCVTECSAGWELTSTLCPSPGPQRGLCGDQLWGRVQ